MDHTEQYLEWHSKMWKAQQDGGDFDLTVRELVDVWKLKSTSAVQFRLKKLVQLGLVRTKKSHAKYTAYRAVAV